MCMCRFLTPVRSVPRVDPVPYEGTGRNRGHQVDQRTSIRYDILYYTVTYSVLYSQV